MALKVEQTKKNKDENKTTEKCVKENKQEQSVKKKSKVVKKYKQKSNTVCLPSGSHTIYSRSASLPLLPTTILTTMATYYPQNYSQSIAIDWNPMVATLQLPSPVYTLPFQPLPVVVSPVVTPLCPYTCAILTPQIIAPVVQPIVTEIPAVNYTYEQESSVSYVNSVIETQVSEQYYEIQEENAITYVDQIDSPTQVTEEYYSITEDSKAAYSEASKDISSDPIEIYLSLPRDLFPTSRMLTIDPNPIIDEFCKLKNVHNHVPWILDLEYGVPRSPVTRQIPIYNVNYNSIHCKNTPDAIHPGFDSCNEEFKRVLLFYYDCVISSLYRGYVILNCDTSVANFQSWLLLPMQVLGMCWP